jgi:hypothetical protein
MASGMDGTRRALWAGQSRGGLLLGLLLDPDVGFTAPRPQDATLDQDDAEADHDCAEQQPVGERFAEDQHGGGDADEQG